MTVRLALDLAIKQVGYAIFSNECEPDDSRVFRDCGVIKLMPWSNKREYIVALHLIVRDFVRALKKEHDAWEIEIAIELANFSNARNTQRMSFIAGIFLQELMNQFYPKEIKIYNANAWYFFFNNQFEKEKFWTSIPREKRKELSIKYFEKVHKIKDWNKKSDVDKSDIADAYWIGYFFDKVVIK